MKTFLVAFLTAFSFHIDAHAQIITTVAGGGAADPGDGGAAADCELNTPTGVAVDAAGNMYICQRDEHRVRKVTPGGVISTIAGTGVAGYSGDGGPAIAAELRFPYSIAIDVSGNIYIGDQSTIRKINTTGFIATVAGTGTMGYSGDNGPATLAELKGPSGIAIDAGGNLYIADADNNRIRKVNPSGIISTIVGSGVVIYNGDNMPATKANLYSPAGVAIDNAGNLFITDCLHHRIRKVTPDGTITTIAGTAVSGFAGDGGIASAAQTNRPIGLCVDNGGNLYIADTYNYRVRKISTTGIITTIAGNGLSGFEGDGGPATAARIVTPTSIAVYPSGGLLVCDFGNDRIRSINNLVSVDANPVSIGQNPAINIFPNPNAGIFTMQVVSAVDEEVSILVTDILGRIILEIKDRTNRPVVLNLDIPTGMYMLSANINGTTVSQKITIIRQP